MSTTVEDYDGLCGLWHPRASSDKQVRCKFELGHHGPCSWKDVKGFTFRIGGSVCSAGFNPDEEFENSVITSLMKIDEDK